MVKHIPLDIRLKAVAATATNKKGVYILNNIFGSFIGYVYNATSKTDAVATWNFARAISQ